ncbi:MAG: RNA polymerase factor sigma-54 [Rhodobiaceae bacterium]|nr:RNA polymerase factor sigma-54 [Rhodobiaceae bacterium]
MALSPKLELRQGQSLVLTPQLQQAIKMLQLSSLDLAAYVESELERNPLLERESGSDDDGGDAPDLPDTTGDGDDWMADTVGQATESIAENIDADPEAMYPEDTGADRPAGAGPSDFSGGRISNGSGFESAPDIEAYLTSEKTLVDHVDEQIALCRFSPAESLIARTMAGHLDEAGYLAEDVAVIAARIGAPLDPAETVLARLQGLEPAGLFARSLAECLELQLRDRDRFDPAMAALVGNLELLAKRDLGGLRKVCGVDDADLADMIAEIRSLNPRPGLVFAERSVQPVIPDIFVTERADGGWAIQLNSDVLPRVLVNQTYYATVSRGARSDSDKAFVAECLQDANWLVKSLEQRARTILKVAREIVRQQDGFLAYGVTHLRPLNLRMVADAIGMHESTVSRVTSNKYMATPRGIFELKYFFTSAIAGTGHGEAVSAEAVRHLIRQMIDAEQPHAVLSDDTIVQKLRDAGIDIARRTVAKYRESMRIPSSVQRRREKQSAFTP